MAKEIHMPRDDRLQARIDLLQEFRNTIVEWNAAIQSMMGTSSRYASQQDAADAEELLRQWLNRNLVAAKRAASEAGVHGSVIIQRMGTSVSVDPFDNMFESPVGTSLVPVLCDMIDRAIGVYEHMLKDTGLVSLLPAEAFDVETAIERALRVAFKHGPPKNEKDVQDQIEVILKSVGVPFTREQETAPVGPRAFRPDFASNELELALEVKFTNDKHTASDAQEEIAADIAAFRTKWKRLLVVIYDMGAITDPAGFREANMKHFGVSVLIVKH